MKKNILYVGTKLDIDNVSTVFMKKAWSNTGTYKNMDQRSGCVLNHKDSND